ncbi:MAG: TonB-dependent receptor, partial [Anaerolineae bacterium]|nr:TonB-dependent receptor [Anaerolineae bacterium]
DLTSKLALTLGLRYTKEDRQMSRTDFIRIPAVGVVIPNELPQASGTFEDVSGTASLTYDWNEDLMTYLKFSKGYVSGGFNPRSPSPDTFEDGYEEEVVYTYELGWKSTWFDRALQLNGAIFYNDYQDLQVNLLDDATARNNIGNAGEAVIQGYEIEMQARP